MFTFIKHNPHSDSADSKHFLDSFLQSHNIDALSPDHQTLLFQAAQFNHLVLLKQLIERGADPNIPDDCQRSPLIIAVRHSNLQAVQLLFGESQLWGNQLAAKRQSLALPDLDYNQFDSLEMNPLHHAASIGNSQLIEYLILHGVYCQVPDLANNLPVDYALRNFRPDVSQLFINLALLPDDGGSFKLMEQVLNRGTPVDIVTYPGSPANPNSGTLLHLAINQGKLGCVRLLLARGANRWAKDATGTSAISLANTINENADHICSDEMLFKLHEYNFNPL